VESTGYMGKRKGSSSYPSKSLREEIARRAKTIGSLKFKRSPIGCEKGEGRDRGRGKSESGKKPV